MSDTAETTSVASFLWWITGIVLAAAALVAAVGVFLRAATWMIP